MGFYDCRCAVTGVSLKCADTALVILWEANGKYSPLALAIKGNYNRLGSIDRVAEDVNTQCVLRYFRVARESGAFAVDEALLMDSGKPVLATIESLLQAFERNINDGPGVAELNGQSITFALVSSTIWEAVTKGAKDSFESRSVSKKMFHAVPIALDIYADSLDQLSAPLGELAAVDAFLISRGLSWMPTESDGQHYSDVMLPYLSEARQTFADCPELLAGLQEYEKEVSELLKD